MKLIIIVTLLALASSTQMQSFLSLDAPSFCGSVAPADMCTCQSSGCAFESDNGVCSAIGSSTGSTTFTAGILGSCSSATTKDSCLTHVAWHNRFGGKIGCAWCSTACVHDEHADDTCTRSSTLTDFLGSWTVTVQEPTEPVPARPTPKEISDRVEENGGLPADKTLLGISLAWENCNDLDLELETPADERIFWSNLQDQRGGLLDIDMNANTC